MTVKEIISQSPLHVAFVNEAISRYAKEVIENKEEVRKQLKNGFINPESWIEIAEQCNK